VPEPPLDVPALLPPALPAEPPPALVPAEPPLGVDESSPLLLQPWIAKTPSAATAPQLRRSLIFLVMIVIVPFLEAKNQPRFEVCQGFGRQRAFTVHECPALIKTGRTDKSGLMFLG
jgi:hypothetical protein